MAILILTIPHNYVDLTGPTRTRSNHDFKIRPKAARTNYYKFSYFNCYVNDWNSLPNSVMSASSINFTT